jgi:predicted enzyme related to lactoylglutathione lyase
MRRVFSQADLGEAEVVKSCGRFTWYELLTSDVEGAKDFYSKVVGWDTRDASSPGMPYVLFTVGETTIAGLTRLWVDATTMGASPHWVGYIGVDDVDAAADKINLRGGAVERPTHRRFQGQPLFGLYRPANRAIRCLEMDEVR